MKSAEIVNISIALKCIFRDFVRACKFLHLKLGGGASRGNVKAISSWRLKIFQNKASRMYFSTCTTMPPDPPVGGKTRVSSSPNLSSRQIWLKMGSKRGPVGGPDFSILSPRFFCSSCRSLKGCLLCEISAPRFHPKNLEFRVLAYPGW